MVAVSQFGESAASSGQRLRLLYIGPYPDELKTILARHADSVAPSYTGKAEDALFLSRNFDFEAVIVDQRDDALATRMILPLMACFNKPVTLVIISDLSEADAYKRIPGVAKLVPVPVREHALFRALGIAKREAVQPVREPAKTAVKMARDLPIAPRRAHRKVKPVWSAAALPIGISAALLVIALASFGLWRVTGWQDGQNHSTSANNVSLEAELGVLEGRIAKAEMDKQKAADVLVRSRQDVEKLLQKIVTLQAVGAEPAGRFERELGSIEREQRDVAKAKLWNRSVVQLRERHAQGLMDEDSLKLSILRILKTDEDEHALRLKHTEFLSAGKERLARSAILKVIAENLNGKSTELPKDVPSDLVPLIRQAAQLLQEQARGRTELDAADRKIELFQQKTRQMQLKAAVVGGLVFTCGRYATGPNSCQMG